ncbi:glycosyltransferase family 2 protein [Psychromonas algicola]|uniref:glycosyltransferase family 2 protein n=1 Tax=Psychromonas algicola TaxID=2555642 RepID=UPI001068C3F6|nr:glycosyltransferase [Psychromonas sp. RZ5]TEW50706.1 glycosyltransferase [Psychromonas sp. RZ5]
MSSVPLVSVVMSVFNAEKYLKEAIESILDQSYQNIEFIIINDGSIDDSLNIIKGFSAIDERIKLVSRRNRGLPFSLNEGLDLAKGEYIARMDADDISFKERLSEQVLYMEANPEIGVCGTWAEVFGEYKNGNSTLKHPSSHDALLPKLLFSVCFIHPTVMFRKEVLNSYKLRYHIDYFNSQDYEFWWRLSHYTKMGNVQKVLLKYRESVSSITHSSSNFQPDLRYKLIKSIFTNVLLELGMKNIESENKLHYICASNSRLRDNKVDIDKLNVYFLTILEHNRKTCVFSDKFLIKVLSKKFIVAIYFECKRNNLNIINGLKFRFFYIGVFNYLKGLIFNE